MNQVLLYVLMVLGTACLMVYAFLVWNTVAVDRSEWESECVGNAVSRWHSISDSNCTRHGWPFAVGSGGRERTHRGDDLPVTYDEVFEYHNHFSIRSLAMNELIFYGACALVLYLWVFDTDRFNEINKAGYDNIEKTGNLFGKGAKAGWTIFKMFKR